MTELAVERVASVVVIDDTPDLRLLLRMVLELSERYTVVAEAGDGASGIQVVQEWQPDVVLLDLAMPVMDGLEALPGIQDVCPNAAVVVLSGFEADRMASQAITQGAAAYLQKGATPDEVVTTLDGVLGRGRSFRPPLEPVASPVETDHDELEHLRSTFATAAHELRTPATVLIGLARTLIKRRESLAMEKIDEILDAIIRQTYVLDRVTADLLTSTQIDHGGVTAQPEVMDVVPAVRAAAVAVADQTDIALHTPERLEVIGDSVRVQQMLTNLVSNAMKYGAAPITITASPVPGGKGLVQVDDSGGGVPVEFRDRLFEQYSRANGSRAAGTGLGLYVVRALAEAQGGAAWYEPLSGGGSRFCFTLPLP
jgi:signal transduction histidine kinase